MARPPLPINIKGHGRLKGSTIEFINYTIIFLPFFPFTFPTHVLFLYYLYGMRGRPSWPPEPRTTQGAPALTGPSRAGIRWFLAGQPGNPGLTAPPTRSNRPTQRCGKEHLRLLVGPEKCDGVVVEPHGSSNADARSVNIARDPDIWLDALVSKTHCFRSCSPKESND
jgi:hypothetical protein